MSDQDSIPSETRLTWYQRLFWGTVGGILGSLIFRALEAYYG